MTNKYQAHYFHVKLVFDNMKNIIHYERETTLKFKNTREILKLKQ